MFVSLRGAQTWRLHTKLYKFGWNTSPNNARMKNRTDLNLCEVVYVSIIYHVPDSWLNLLNGYDFYFWWRDSENQQFDVSESHYNMSICPKHRDAFGIRWRCRKRFCSVPPSWAPHQAKQMKGDRSITFVQSKLIYKMTSTLVPIGSRKHFSMNFSQSNLVANDNCSTTSLRWLFLLTAWTL
jgi:hypothetical protein